MIEIRASSDLAGIKVGLFIPSHKTIYVSDSVKALCDDDLDLMRRSLIVLEMPLLNGKEQFDSLADWIAYLIQNGRDIFCPTTKSDIRVQNDGTVGEI